MGKVPRGFEPGKEAGLVSSSLTAVGWDKNKSDLKRKARRLMSSVN